MPYQVSCGVLNGRPDFGNTRDLGYATVVLCRGPGTTAFSNFPPLEQAMQHPFFISISISQGNHISNVDDLRSLSPVSQVYVDSQMQNRNSEQFLRSFRASRKPLASGLLSQRAPSTWLCDVVLIHESKR